MFDFKHPYDKPKATQLLTSNCPNGTALRDWLATAVLPLITADGAYILGEENNASAYVEGEDDAVTYEAPMLLCPNGDGPELRRWVLDEILPSLHANGGYASDPRTTLEQLMSVKAKRYTLPGLPHPIGFTLGEVRP